MIAVVADGTGGPDVLKVQELPDPEPGPDEALLEVAAIGVNRADLLQREGRYPPPPGASPLLGLELSGRLADDATGLSAGTRAMALVGGGAYATRAVVHVSHLIPIPGDLSDEEAAAVPEAFLTAFHNLFDVGELKRGQAVLIHAAGSGVGTAAIQLARQAGALVIATSRTPAKLDRCQELGADITIATGTEDFAERVLTETGGKGVDLILDFVGAAYWDKNIRSLARHGRMALIGTMGGGTAAVDLGHLLHKRLRVEGSTLRGLTIEEKASLVMRAAPMLIPGFISKALRPILDRVFPLEQAANAHRYMESNEGFGKIVLSTRLNS